MNETEEEDAAGAGNFHPVKSASLVSGLLINPRFQANTYRIEGLIHYILATFNGTQRPSHRKIKTWLNDFPPISGAALMEDPVEDVFVTNVMTDKGDFRIYEGIWEANDFCLQKVLDTIKTIPSSFDSDALFKSIYALLSLSEKVAQRNRCHLYQLANSQDKTDINVPGNETLKVLAKSLTFTELDLQKIGYELKDLSPFFFVSERRDALNGQQFGNTDLERSPLVYDGNKVILILPTAVSIAIRRFIFEWLNQNGLADSFEKNFVGQYIQFLQETPILGKPIPPHIPLNPRKISEAYFIEVFAEIDKGRYLQVIVKIDTLDGVFDDGMDNPAPHSQEQVEEIERRIKLASSSFNNREGFREGLTLVISCGYGRPYIAALSDIPANWDVQFIAAHDLDTMGWIPGASSKSLWTLLSQQKKLEEYNIQFMNVNGVLNLYGWWEQNDHILIPDQLEIGTGQWMLSFPTDCIAKVRQKSRKASNLHSEKYIDGSFKRVRRKHLSSIFEEEQNEPLYASYEDRYEGLLLGCAVTKDRTWWVSLHRDNGSLDFTTKFKIWDATHNWLERIGEVFGKKFPHISLEPALVSLDLSNLPIYERLPDAPPQANEALIDVSIKKDERTVYLHFKEPFLYHMHSPINISEKELVRACVKGFVDLFEIEISTSEIDTLCDVIVPNQYARHIHIFKAYKFRDVIRAHDECSTTKIENFDANFLKIGLGHIDGTKGAREIKGKAECVSFLNSVVAEVWKQLKIELKKYNRESLIIAALRNIEAIASEKDQWDRTARAVLGLHHNEEQVHQGRMKQFTLFYGADLASRLLVETAVCECPITTGHQVGSLDLSPLMARAALLHHIGNLSDAIDKGVTEPIIHIAGNGEIKYEHDFHDNIIQPFAEQFEKSSLQSSAKNYEKRFEEMPLAKNPSEVFEAQFLTAFEKEIGISVEALRNFREVMENMAVEKETYVFMARQSEIIAYCEKSELSNKVDAIKALQGFTLSPRENWDKPPAGYKSRDINPWLFRRRLSLLLKPYIRINEEEDPTYIISPGISSLALAYTLDVYSNANIEEDRCHSQEMKKWIGDERRRKGHEFNKEVASLLEALGYEAKSDVKVSSIIPKQNLDKDYGDVDVLAWKTGGSEIYVIECKDLYHAKTTKEIAEQLLEFKGEERNGKRDRLKKHTDRIDVLNKNKSDISKFCNLQDGKTSLVPYVVFSNPVPILYDQAHVANDVKFTYLKEIKDNGLKSN